MCCLTFSISKPFRKSIFSNPVYFVCVWFMFGFQIFLILNVNGMGFDAFNLMPYNSDFMKFLLVVVLINSIATYLYEKFFIYWLSTFWNKRQAVKKQERLQQYIQSLDNAYEHKDQG